MTTTLPSLAAPILDNNHFSIHIPLGFSPYCPYLTDNCIFHSPMQFDYYQKLMSVPSKPVWHDHVFKTFQIFTNLDNHHSLATLNLILFPHFPHPSTFIHTAIRPLVPCPHLTNSCCSLLHTLYLPMHCIALHCKLFLSIFIFIFISAHKELNLCFFFKKIK